MFAALPRSSSRRASTRALRWLLRSPTANRSGVPYAEVVFDNFMAPLFRSGAFVGTCRRTPPRPAAHHLDDDEDDIENGMLPVCVVGLRDGYAGGVREHRIALATPLLQDIVGERGLTGIRNARRRHAPQVDVPPTRKQRRTAERSLTGISDCTCGARSAPLLVALVAWDSRLARGGRGYAAARCGTSRLLLHSPPSLWR